MSAYAQPSTFMEVLLDTTNMLEKYKHDTLVTKEDLVESMESRLSLIMGKFIAMPINTSFSLFHSNE
jgi:hypothetical protein